MKTRILSLVVALFATITLNAYDFQDGDLYYNITSDGTVEVVNDKSYSELTVVVIPSTLYNYYDVTSIDWSAFEGCTGLTSITIPNSVTSIGSKAFSGCTGLTSITIPNSVTSIEWSTFEGCTGLTSVTIPNSVWGIEDNAFSGCTGLTSVTIPNSVWSIGDNAFSGCTGLTSITIPNSVTSIGSEAFSGCTGLTSVTIPNSVRSIGDGAFYACTGLTSITIPNNVTSIGGSAFSGCTGLTSITIPNSVTEIGGSAFSGCTGLTSITIPNSVTEIGGGAFYGCTGLTSIIVENGNKVYDSRNNCNAIIETETNTLIRGCNTTIIPNSVTSIGYDAFYGCTGLTSVTIGKSVTSIGEGAFSDCSGLMSIIVENGNKVYDSRSNCNAIIETSTNTLIRGCNTTVIPNSVTSIGDNAFSGCTGLTSITIPNSVTSIGYGAFSDCSGLASIVVENGNKVYDSRSNCNAIIETSTNTLIQGCKTTIIPNSVTSIGNEAFYGCTGLTSIIIPNSVTSIEDFAFCGCTGLTSLTIPNSVMDVGEDAFGGCTGLTSVLIGNNSELSMDATFFGYANLTQVTCYANVPPHIWLPEYFDKDRLTEITLYVPVSAVGDYKEANGWKYFGHIVPIGATATDTDEPVIMPSYTEVTIAWPTTIGAKTYTITITKDGKTISSLTFDDTGLLINAAFAAPSYNGNARQAPAAQYTQSAFWFTFSGLECNTQYDYSIVAQSSNGQPISTYNGTFRTTAPTAIDNVSSNENSDNAATHTRKIFHNGQVLIQHNGKTYTISGNEVK